MKRSGGARRVVERTSQGCVRGTCVRVWAMKKSFPVWGVR